MTRSLHIALLASARYPVAEPFAGGLEAHTWMLASGLRAHGHRVTLFAGAGSDPELDAHLLPVHWPRFSHGALSDPSTLAPAFLREHHAYLDVMLSMGKPDAPYDLLHNNSLHYLPVAMAASLRIPVVTTLHTPPTPWLESALQTSDSGVTFVAVSRHTAAAWAHAVPDIRVIPNGVDIERWRPGPGGGSLVWSGRLTPEKGAHIAIEAARLLGLPLDLAGPISDSEYFHREIAPRVGGKIRYVGHLGRKELIELVGRASVCLVTPIWDEPYGLVAAEALACGTPVAGFDRGAIAEIVDSRSGVVVPGRDPAELARAVMAARGLSRTATRRQAENHCSATAMITRYEELYRDLLDDRVAA
jgi:glycosyltransferase involved in cell wall biosynthesis